MLSLQDEKSIKINNYLKEIQKELPEYVSSYINFCKSTKNYSLNTTLGYARDILLFYKFLVKANPSINKCKDISLELIESLSPLDLQEFISEISVYQCEDGEFVESPSPQSFSSVQTRTNGASAKARKIASIRNFYNYFYGMGMIKTNPAAIIAGPKQHKKEIIRLERNESNLLLTALNNTVKAQENMEEKSKRLKDRFYLRDLTIITLLLATGIRVSECENLNLGDIIWNKQALKIVRKGGNEDVVYYNDDVESLLLSYIESPERIEPLISVGIDPEALDTAVFISHRGTRLTARSIERLVKKHTTAVGITYKKITPHKLRSTFGTNTYQQTGDVYLTADLLGHSDLSTVQRYAEIDDKRKLNARDNVNWTNV